MKLTSLKRPFICLVVSEASPDEAVRLIDAHENRVDAFEVNLTMLQEKAFGEIFASTNRLCLATNRRPSFMEFYGHSGLPPVTEEERARRLMKALDSGAAAIDCELDMFDETRQKTKPKYSSREERKYAESGSPPAELSKERRAVAKQREIARSVKGIGAETVFSCHTQTVIDRTQGATIISAMQERGADLGKIVSLTFHVRDLIPFMDTAISLKADSAIPFNLMNVGSESILGRLLSVELGSSWVYCRPDFGASFKGQPSVDQAKTFFGMMAQH
jgi:3-dehydroquinate dehydratase